MQVRLSNADKVFELLEDYDVMNRLKADAWQDYWDEVPELRTPEAQNWLGRFTRLTGTGK